MRGTSYFFLLPFIARNIVQAANATYSVTTVLPALTVLSCPPTTVIETYVSTYLQPCPTGLVPETYTIAETCPCDAATRTGIPSGFTSAVVVIGTTTETITCPVASIDAYSQSGYIQPVSPTISYQAGAISSAPTASYAMSGDSSSVEATAGGSAPSSYTSTTSGAATNIATDVSGSSATADASGSGGLADSTGDTTSGQSPTTSLAVFTGAAAPAATTNAYVLLFGVAMVVSYSV